MRKRRRILLAALLVASLCCVVWLLIPSGPPDPIYEGHPVSNWLRHPKTIYDAPGEGTRYLPEMDSNAVPYLLSALETKEWPLHAAYVHLWERLPDEMERFLGEPVTADDVRQNACLALSAMPEKAKPAIPALIRLIRNENEIEVRKDAMYLLGIIGKSDARAKDALIPFLKDADAYVRCLAADGLQTIDMKDSQVVRALNEALKDPDSNVRTHAFLALDKFDSAPAEQSGEK